jgi:hypothetical protein
MVTGSSRFQVQNTNSADTFPAIERRNWTDELLLDFYSGDSGVNLVPVIVYPTILRTVQNQHSQS